VLWKHSAAEGARESDADRHFGAVMVNDRADLLGASKNKLLRRTLEPWDWEGWSGGSTGRDDWTALVRSPLLLLLCSAGERDRLAAEAAAPSPTAPLALRSDLAPTLRAAAAAWPADRAGPPWLSVFLGSAWRERRVSVVTRMDREAEIWRCRSTISGPLSAPMALAWPLLWELAHKGGASGRADIAVALAALPIRNGSLRPAGGQTPLASLALRCALGEQTARNAMILQQWFPEMVHLESWWDGELLVRANAPKPQALLPEIVVQLGVRAGCDPLPAVTALLVSVGERAESVTPGIWILRTDDLWREIQIQVQPDMVSMMLRRDRLEDNERPPSPPSTARSASAEPLLWLDVPLLARSYHAWLQRELGEPSPNKNFDHYMLPPLAVFERHLVPWALRLEDGGLSEDGYPLAALWLHVAATLADASVATELKRPAEHGEKPTPSAAAQMREQRLLALRAVQALGSSRAAKPSIALAEAGLDPALLAPFFGGKRPDAAAIDALGTWQPAGALRLRLRYAKRAYQVPVVQWLIACDEEHFVLTPQQALCAHRVEGGTANTATNKRRER
jgi:hypothetical protein